MLLLYDLKKQYLNFESRIDDAVKNVLSSGQYMLGQTVETFEREFSRYVGSRFGLGVASGTDALILSLKVLNIGPGDEVITTPFTAPATIAAIGAAGAKVVFADIDPETFLFDLNKVSDCITKKTKAIVAVHIFGNMIDLDKLIHITDNQIPILEDACQAHGSMLRGRMAGTIGLLGSFSFYPTKNLGGCGDGGIVVTDDEQLYGKLALLRQYGMVDRDTIVVEGYNSRLDALQAAILSTKLVNLNESNQRRKAIAQYYRERLNSEKYTFQKIQPDVVSNFHVFSVLVEENRDKLVQFLTEQGIQTQIYYKTPIVDQEAYRKLGYKISDYPCLDHVCKRVLAIPVAPELSDSEVSYITEALNRF